jgi:hypothetical protein
MPLRLRRGTDVERQSITPKEGELIYVTDTKEIYVGDGSSQGGNLFNTSILYDATPSLGGNLDLNGKNIVGAGNINIDGTITATGNINLGDGAEDNVIVGGQISSPLTPAEDGVYDLGYSASRWRNGFFEGLEVDSKISTDTISVTRIINQDSTTVFDGISFFGNLDGDVVGSVFGDDSTLLIDSVGQSLNTSLLTIQDNQISGPSTRFTIDKESTQNTVTSATTSGTSGGYPQFIYEISQGDINNLESVTSGSILGSIMFKGYTDFGYKPTFNLINTLDSTANLNDQFPASGAAIFCGAGGDSNQIYTFDHIGRFSTLIVHLAAFNEFTNSYTNIVDISDRDTKITTPEPGMIIYIEDDGSGSPAFQGYKGDPINNWVNLSP